MKDLTDEALIREVQEGTISAFEHLVLRYQGKLHSFVSWIVKNPDTASDIVQETFIRMYKNIDRIDTTKKFSSLLFASARNMAISSLRTNKYYASISKAEEIASTETPQALLEKDDDRNMISAALDEIDKKYKRVITLYYYDDLSYEEIALRMQVPINTIRTHIRRAKEALRKKLT